jgi:hypothetical protein
MALVFWTPWYCTVLSALPLIIVWIVALSDEDNSRRRKLADYVVAQGWLKPGEFWQSYSVWAFGLSEERKEFVDIDDRGQVVCYRCADVVRAVFEIDEGTACDSRFWP